MNIPMTRAGIQRLDDDLRFLTKVRRREISKAIGEAIDQGDISENAEYHAAKDEQAQVEARIISLSNLRSMAVPMIMSELKNDIINFGALVTVFDDLTDKKIKYRIVSEYEADVSKLMISNVSPLGRSLIGKEKGDVVEVNAPGGFKYYEVKRIEYSEI
jgi:transcription elongation factor GreA